MEVSRHAGEQMPAACWAVARRYSEFHELHRQLRAQYPFVRRLDFPRRRVVMKLQQEFLRKRRIALETYLQVGHFARGQTRVQLQVLSVNIGAASSSRRLP